MSAITRRRYEGRELAADKVVATLSLIMFVLIAGLGHHAQPFSKAPVAASATAMPTVQR